MNNNQRRNLQFFDFSLPKEISCESWVFDSNFANDIVIIDFNKWIFNEIN